MDNPSIISAFLSGVLSFLSPCILPLLPGYVSFISGKSIEELTTDKRNATITAVIGAIAFGVGFSTVFVILGASATAVGQLFNQYKDILSKIGGVIIIIFGLHMFGVFKIKLLYKQAKFNYTANFKLPFYIQAFILGLVFVLGWTPCVGPILSAILMLAAKGDTVLYGAKLLFIYSLGLWIPFLITALLINKALAFTRKLHRFLSIIEKISAILLILIGVLLVTDNLTAITVMLLKFIPSF